MAEWVKVSEESRDLTMRRPSGAGQRLTCPELQHWPTEAGIKEDKEGSS